MSQAEAGLSLGHAVSSSLFLAAYSSFLISASRSLGAVVDGYLQHATRAQEVGTL